MKALEHIIELVQTRRPRLLAIGGSAGSIEALMGLVRGLRADAWFATVIVVHLPAGRESLLPSLLAPLCALPVQEAEPWQEIRAGHVYVAPPGYHLGVEPDQTFSLSADDPVNYARPSVDILFDSAARFYGPLVLGLLLTGANSDGAAGMERLAAAGGLTIVQDPASAQRPEMPKAALSRLEPNAVLGLTDIRALLGHMGGQPLNEVKP